MGDLVPYIQYEKIEEVKGEDQIVETKKKTKENEKKRMIINEDNNLKNVSIPKGISLGKCRPWKS